MMLVWRLRAYLLTCAVPECERRAVNPGRPVIKHGSVYAPYVIVLGDRYPLCRRHACDDGARVRLINELLGAWPLEVL